MIDFLRCSSMHTYRHTYTHTQTHTHSNKKWRVSAISFSFIIFEEAKLGLVSLDLSSGQSDLKTQLYSKMFLASKVLFHQGLVSIRGTFFYSFYSLETTTTFLTKKYF